MQLNRNCPGTQQKNSLTQDVQLNSKSFHECDPKHA
jgi:hypothetical protein